MKKLFLSLLCTIPFSLCIAQTDPFTKGQLEAKAGIGFISTLNATLQEATGGTASMKFTSPPLSLSAEYAITDEISVGGFVGMAQTRFRAYGAYEEDKYFFIGPRGSYHFDVHPKFDVYSGLALYYGRVTGTQDDGFGGTISGSKSDAYYQVFGGGKYAFSKLIGIYAELGYGITVGNVGITLKLK